MSFTQWLTRSAPIVSCLFRAKAIFNFVRTPLMLATRTGWRIPGKFARNKPPKPPILLNTCGPCVCLTSDWMPRLSLLPRSTSTPARAYAFFRVVIPSRADGQGIIPVETGQAKAIHRLSCRAHHAFYIKVTEAIDTEVFADVFHRHLVRNQLFRIGEVDSVVTSKPVWRTAHTHVHFFCASFAQIHYSRSRSRPAHDRVVYNHDPFSGYHFLNQIQLHPHVEIANELAWL